MADLPSFVEEISSDNDSLDDQASYFSTSSTELYDDELKAIYDDHDSGTRWINQFIATPPSASEVQIKNAEALKDIDKSQYPVGSTIDMSRPLSPADLCGFPYLDLSPPTYGRNDIEPQSV